MIASEADLISMIRRRRGRWIRRLMTVALVFGIASFTAAASDFPGDRLIERLSGLTSVRSLATWMQTVLFLAIGSLALFTAARDSSRRALWRLIGIASLLLSAEEVVGLHEMGEPVAVLPTDQPPSLTWLLGALAIAGLLAGALTPFLRNLPRAVAARFVFAAVLFTTGTIGLQFVGELIAIARGESSLAYIAIHNLEELTELVGLILLLDATLLQIGSLNDAVRSDDQGQGQPPR